MRKQPFRFGRAAMMLVFATLLIAPARAKAGMVVTDAGLALGFRLSTFASDFPNDGSTGPIGMGFNSTGGVLVGDFTGGLYQFATDTDGQSANGAVLVTDYGFSNAFGIAQLGGAIYMTQQSNSDVVQINDDGTFNQLIATGIPLASGIVADPLNGQLYVSTLGVGEILQVDPTSGNVTVFNNASIDGLSISPDGSTLYGAGEDGHVYGYSTIDGTQVFDSGFIDGGPDGTALGVGRFAGNIFTNTNGGQVIEINLGTLQTTLIADGGSRGDFVTIDPNDGSILLTQTDSILRLSIGAEATPEPSTWAAGLIGAATLGLLARRKRVRA
jgi:MYXO-CTERM domain-containing protein